MEDLRNHTLLYHAPGEKTSGKCRKCKRNVEDSFPSVFFFVLPLKKTSSVFDYILFPPQPTKERNWENEEEL
jgi:hypothetical protein